MEGGAAVRRAAVKTFLPRGESAKIRAGIRKHGRAPKHFAL